jgi:CRISPR-associated endonuclease/helicase Cas3
MREQEKPEFWAKTGQGKLQADGRPKYHPVICHLADTAAVAMKIVRSHLSPVARRHLAQGLGLSNDEALIRFCGFMAGSHDLGKVSPAFQFQVSEVGKILAGGELYDLWYGMPKIIQQKFVPHGTVTAKTLPEFLVEIGVKQTVANRLAIIVGGHHGFFPSSEEINKLDDELAGTKEDGVWWQRKYSRDIFQKLQEFVNLTPEDLPTQCDNAAAMILAGLTTVSDWIASNPDEETGFPYADDQPFAAYQEKLSEKAERALKAIGWATLPMGKPLSFSELFPKIKEPRELQKQAVASAETLTAPCLVLVEASMGEGKTEAAFYLSDYLQQQEGTGGFYIGLPTQATSNAMFNRVKDFLGSRYSKEDFPDLINLTLSHSAATLKEDYQSSICRLDYQEQVYDDIDYQRVVVREWHTARKRTLLSPYGVGTLDQALMGALRSRHQFVRLFGLAGRTVILDEIHAYDLYTGTLIERFLEWLALLGSPVIALSATLPSDTRKRLVHSYTKGCGYEEPELSTLPVSDYPRLTSFTPKAGVKIASFKQSSHLTRNLHLHWIKEIEWLDELIKKLDEGGGCVAVICSTVGRAQAVFQTLNSSPHFAESELGLFHGRFLFISREEIEQNCIGRFGKPSDPKTNRPFRYVLVATQVIEQSLDLDFDLIVSDLAPVDLLLQRSGRLHRHEERRHRPAKLDQPTLWLIEPLIDKNGKANFGDAEFIYDHHILLKTWLTLRDRAKIPMPSAMDDLIESVYDLETLPHENLESAHIEDWQASLEQHRQNQTAYKSLAQKVYLPSARGKHKPYEFTQGDKEDDDNTVFAATRLGEKSVTTIFVQRTLESVILPISRQKIDLNEQPNSGIIRSLLGHSTRISKKGLVDEILKLENPKKWKSALLRHCRCVELDGSGKAQIGRWEISLEPKRGVVINSTS